MELPGRRGQQDARLVDVAQLDAPFDQGVQELDDVVVVDQRVGELQERVEDRRLGAETITGSE